MAVRHLTDEQIQRYLDGNMRRDDDAADHLRQCPACQRQLELYGKVYEGLRQDVGFELSPGFAQSVVTRLATTCEKRLPDNLARLILVVFGTVVAAGMALYFLEIGAVGEKAARLSAVLTGFGASFVESLKAATTSLGVSTDIVLFTSLILLTFAAVDRIVFRYRGSHFCL